MQECFKYFGTRDRTLAIQRFLSRWIFYALKLEDNVTTRLIFTRQEFKKPEESSSDEESAVNDVPTTVKKETLTPIDRAYLQRIASRSNMANTSLNHPVKNIEYDSVNNSNKQETCDNVFSLTQSRYNPPQTQPKATYSKITNDQFLPIIGEAAKYTPTESNSNQPKTLSTPNYNPSSQRRNNVYSSESKDTLPTFISSLRKTQSNFQSNTTLDLNRNVTQSTNIIEISRSGFIPPARPTSKPSIRRDPPKSLMELTGLPSGPSRGRTLIRSKSISSIRSGSIVSNYNSIF